MVLLMQILLVLFPPKFNIIISCIQLPTSQSTTIEVTINHTPIKMSSAYFPPSLPITLQQLELFLQSLGRYFLVGGDFNSKHSQWGCISKKQKGKMLHSIITKNSINFISPKGPTYWPLHENRHPDILDFFLSKLPTHINYSISNLCKLSFDHTHVPLAVNNAPKPNIPNTSLSQGSFN